MIGAEDGGMNEIGNIVN